MPACLDPKRRFSLPLRWGEETSGGSLHFRPLTGRRWMEFLPLYLSRFKTEDPNEALSRAFDALRSLVVGWDIEGEDGKAIPFDAAGLEDVLTAYEAQEILDRAVEGMRPTESDRKKSASPSPSGSDASKTTSGPSAAGTASPASAATATAETPPASPAPPATAATST